MESIFYNNTDKQVVVILGYGIGSHLSVNYLNDIISQIGSLFRNLTVDQLVELKFSEVSDSSRRHKRHWYTRFDYDLGELDGPFTVQDVKGYAFSDYPGNPKGGQRPESETAKSIMNRLIHD